MEFKLAPATAAGTEPYQLEMEVGLATYTTTSTSATYRTNLDTVVAGFAHLVNDATIETDAKSYYSIPIGAVTSNAILVSRSSHQALSGAVVCVLLIGRRSTI